MPNDPGSQWLGRLSQELAEAARLHWHVPNSPHIEEWCTRADVHLLRQEQLLAGRYFPGERAAIALRSSLSPDRVPFTLAHELGHHFLQQCRTSARLRASLSPAMRSELADFAPGAEQEETICDRFAAAWLLDSRQAHEWADSSAPNIESLLRFATSRRLHVRDAFARIVDCTDYRGTMLEVDSSLPSPRVVNAIGRGADEFDGAETLHYWLKSSGQGNITIEWWTGTRVLRTFGTVQKVAPATTYVLVRRSGPVVASKKPCENCRGS